MSINGRLVFIIMTGFNLVKFGLSRSPVTNIYSLLAIRQRNRVSPVHGLALILTLFLSGCAAPSLQERIDTAEAIAAGAGLHARVLSGRTFSFKVYQRLSATPRQILVIYIEGDGLAWRSKRRISDNPTPINPVALRLAARDPSAALAYIARPCQYLPLDGEPGCSPLAWTDARYSRKIVQDFAQIVTRLKTESGSRRIGLVGFSGGGTIAALLAAERRDVAWLVTVAGNLNPDLWARLHRISPLRASLNPVDAARTLENIPQIHLLGGADSVMPAAVAESLRTAMDRRDRIRIVTVPGQDHGCCWQQTWPRPLCENIGLTISSCARQP